MRRRRSVVDADWQTRAVQDAHRTLGRDARIRRAGDAVTAEAAGRRLTWSLDQLAARAVEELGDRRGGDVGSMTESGGRVHRVQGPLVEAAGLRDVAVSSLVAARRGEAFPARSSAIREGVTTVEAYEYTGGLRPGDPVAALGVPLSARLGPGLLGGVYDGLLRPLSHAPMWLEPGTVPDRRPTRPRFVPGVREGDLVGPGAELGVVRGGGVVHRVLVPPTACGPGRGPSSEGPCGDDDVVAVVGGSEVPLTTRWPVRPRARCASGWPPGRP